VIDKKNFFFSYSVFLFRSAAVRSTN
jgi:hypothetical protein